MKTEKPVEERIKETVTILQDLKKLGILDGCAPMVELREHLNRYVKDGECWSGTIDFLRFGRIAEVDLPRRADKAIEVVLRLPRVGRH